MPRFVISILIPILLAASILSCEKAGAPTPSESPRNENTLRYDVSVPFTSLDPTQGVAYGSTLIHPLLYSYLFAPNAKGTLEPDLAGKWFYNPEEFIWTVHLREGVLFHDNRPVTSMDVKYSLEQVLRNNRPSMSSKIDRVFIVSDTAISIHLNEDDRRFLHKAWDMAVVPAPGDSGKGCHDHPIGSGPFRFVHRIGEKEVVLEANEDYYQGRASVDRIVLSFQPGKEKVWTRLLSGGTDIAREISAKNYEIIQQYEESYYFDIHPLEWYTILLYNTNHPLFSDPLVRRALSHAIDRKHIVENVLRGLGVVAVGPMGVNSPFHNPEIKPTPYDPKKGFKLLQRAGWSCDEKGRHLVKDGELFEFTIFVFKESQIEKKVAHYIRLCLNELGIKVHLQYLPFSELTGRYVCNNEFEAALTEFRGVYRDFEGMKPLWCPNSSGKSAAGGFEDDELSRLVNQALRQTDPGRKKQLIYEIEALIVSRQPGTFLFHKAAIDVMSKRFKLPFPFSLKHDGIRRLLQHASLSEDWLSGR